MPSVASLQEHRIRTERESRYLALGSHPWRGSSRACDDASMWWVRQGANAAEWLVERAARESDPRRYWLAHRVCGYLGAEGLPILLRVLDRLAWHDTERVQSVLFAIEQTGVAARETNRLMPHIERALCAADEGLRHAAYSVAGKFDRATARPILERGLKRESRNEIRWDIEFDLTKKFESTPCHRPRTRLADELLEAAGCPRSEWASDCPGLLRIAHALETLSEFHTWGDPVIEGLDEVTVDASWDFDGWSVFVRLDAERDLHDVFATHLVSGASRIERDVFDERSAETIAAFGARLRGEIGQEEEK